MIGHSTGAGGNLTCPGLTAAGASSVVVGIMIFTLCFIICCFLLCNFLPTSDDCVEQWRNCCCCFLVVLFMSFVIVVSVNTGYVFARGDYLSSSANSTADGSICGNPALLFGFTIISYPLVIIYCITCSWLIYILCYAWTFLVPVGRNLSNLILISQ